MKMMRNYKRDGATMMMLLMALLHAAMSFTTHLSFQTPARTFAPRSKASIAHKTLAALVEDESSVVDFAHTDNRAGPANSTDVFQGMDVLSSFPDGKAQDAVAENVVSIMSEIAAPVNQEVVALGDSNNNVEMDVLSFPTVEELDVGKDMVMAVMSDTSVVSDFINKDGFVTDLPMKDELIDDLMMNGKRPSNGDEATKDVLILDGDDVSIPTAETVNAVLAASEEAAKAAEAILSKEEAAVVPLIPHSNDTVAVHVEEKPTILPASDVVGEPATLVPVEVETPDVMKILKFAIPAIGVWLCGPLLSLIDTSAVGLFSGTFQQAALNPAVAVTDYAALLIAFMYTATTNLVASSQETDRGVEGKPVTTRNFRVALQLSGFVGAGLGALLFVFARTLLRAIIGNDGIHPEVFGAAMKYVRIRALGMPAAVVIGSAQAACLGMQDIKSPLYVLLAAAVVNLCGDLVFVRSTSSILGGAAGAAWATVFSQYAAAFLFLKWLCDRPKVSPKVVNVSKAIMELTGDAKSQGETRRRKLSADLRKLAKNVGVQNNPVSRRLASIKKLLSSLKKPQSMEKTKTEEPCSTRGFLAGKLHFRDLLKLPPREDIEHFTPYVVPVTTTQVGRVSSYVAMSHVVSSSLGTLSMAAQQIIVSVFYCLTPVADSLSLTAQSFVPVISEKKISRARAVALRKTGLSFLKAGIAFGVGIVGAVGMMPLVSRCFTSDPAVITLVNSVAPWLVGFFAVHGVCIGAEGMLLGQKDLSFLGKAYASYFFAVPYLMLRLKRKALAGVGDVGLQSLWKLFFAYNVFRCALWVARAARLQTRTERQAAVVEEASAL